MVIVAGCLALVGTAKLPEAAEKTGFPAKARTFPALGSEVVVRGELIAVDFIHRSGQLRVSSTGELRDFQLLPFGSAHFRNAEADLRDIPLGTEFAILCTDDSTRKALAVLDLQDSFTVDARREQVHRVEEVRLGDGLLVTLRVSHSAAHPVTDASKTIWRVKDFTRVWKGNQPAKLTDLMAGDELLVNHAGNSWAPPAHGQLSANPVCTDIWIGGDAQAAATAQQRKQFHEFVKCRGLPGWIDQTKDNFLTITFFSGEPARFRSEWMSDFLQGRDVQVVVANDELRTWNPPVDKERATIVEVRETPPVQHGCSGVTVVLKMNSLLEGFRRGRVVRVFGTGWPIKDQFYAESLMGYGYGRLQTSEVMENTAKEYPSQFPFRTDFGNAHLPWYRLQPSVVPPKFAEHVEYAALVAIDGAARSGTFRRDRTGELVEITLLPEGTVRILNAEAKFSELSVGQRYRLHLFQDSHGNFTATNLITDDFSHLASQAITYRVEQVSPTAGTFTVACQIPEVKNYNGDMEQPPDLGRLQLQVASGTRFWKDDAEVKFSDVTVGDLLLVNRTCDMPNQPAHCTDVWIGRETHKQVSERQTLKAKLKK